MRKKSIAGTGILAAAILSLVVFGCASPVSEQAAVGLGSVTISFPQEGSASKTLLPVFTVHHYDISGTGPRSGIDAFESLGVEAPGLTVDSLIAGEWKIVAYGKNAAGETVARGEATFIVTDGQTVDCRIAVNFLQEKTGDISVTLDWPLGVGIDSVSATFDGIDENQAIPGTEASFAFGRDAIASGFHLLTLKLKKNGLTFATVIRSIHVYDFFESSETISLAATDFKAAPAAPANLSGSIGPSRIDLSWNDSSFVETGFTVERSLSAGTGFTAIASDLPANTITFSDTTIVAGQTYHYRVKATNSFGDSPYSAEASGVITIPLPPVPETRARTMDAKPKISWAAVTDAAEYRYQMDSESGAWTVVSRLYFFSPELSNGAHVAYVQSGDGHGNWSASGSCSFEVHWSKLRVLNDSINRAVECYDSVVSGNYLYMLEKNRGLVIYDVATDPSQPKEIGSFAYDSVASYNGTIQKAGNYVFSVGPYPYNIRITDVSDPANPKAGGEIASLSDQTSCIYAASNTLYVCYYGESPAIYDITNPGLPAFKGRISSVPNGSSACIKGSYLYIGGYDGKLHILDNSSPYSPSLVKSIDLSSLSEDSDSIKSIVVDSDNYGFALVGEQPVILDLSFPATAGIAQVLSSITDDTTNSMPAAIIRIGDYAYLSDDYGRDLLVVDVKNPNAPTIVKRIAKTKGFGVRPNGSYAYVGDAAGGLMVLDISTPASTSVAHTYPATQPNDVAISGSYAYFAAGKAGLQIVDISDPLTAKIVKTVTFGAASEIKSLHISGNFLYAGEFIEGKVHVVDISDPLDAQLDYSINCPGFNSTMDGTDSYVYTSGGAPSSVKVLDIHDPSSASFVKSITSLSDEAAQICTSGNYVYLASNYSGFDVIDLVSGTFIKTIDLQRAYGVAAAKGYAYVSDETGSVFIYDVADPASITAHAATVPNLTYGLLSVYDDYLFVASRWGSGFNVVDIKNPLAASKIATYEVGKKIVASGNYLYAVDANKGLVILGD